MMPTLKDLGLEFEKFEIEWISASCVRLVGWAAGERMLVLTADPKDQEDLRELLEVPEVMYCQQAGLDREEVWKLIRSRRHGQ